jgi:hypothetical protein
MKHIVLSFPHPLCNTLGNQTLLFHSTLLPKCFVARNGDANFFLVMRFVYLFVFKETPSTNRNFLPWDCGRNLHDYEALTAVSRNYSRGKCRATTLYSTHWNRYSEEAALVYFQLLAICRHLRIRMQVHCPSTPVFGKLGFKLRSQLQFKCDLEQNAFWSLALSDKANLWKCVEMVNTVRRIREVNCLIFAPKWR